MRPSALGAGRQSILLVWKGAARICSRPRYLMEIAMISLSYQLVSELVKHKSCVMVKIEKRYVNSIDGVGIRSELNTVEEYISFGGEVMNCKSLAMAPMTLCRGEEHLAGRDTSGQGKGLNKLEACALSINQELRRC